MGLRFRKSLKLAPGLRMNVGLRSLSLSLGPRGANVNVRPRGLQTNVGIPGTGLAFRKHLGTGTLAQRATRELSVDGLAVAFNLHDDGTLEIVRADGAPLPPRAIKRAREQQAERLHVWLEEMCEQWNKGIEDLLGIHLGTPRPDRRPADATCLAYSEAMPTRTRPLRVTLLARLLMKRRQIEAFNAEAERRFEAEVAAWTERRQAHDRSEAERIKMFDVDHPLTSEQVQLYLSDVLGRIAWPRETMVSLQVDDSSTGVLIDVDLPEIEDMPEKAATVAARGLKLNIRDRSPVQRRKEYMTHVHGVLFRVIGEVFAAMPRVKQVVASGFSQRAVPETGHGADEYLVSVRVLREEWMTLNFANLSALETPAVLGAFDIRRDMTGTGVFRPIEPFSTLRIGTS